MKKIALFILALGFAAVVQACTPQPDPTKGFCFHSCVDEDANLKGVK